MASRIFVNLPVKNLSKSMAFFSKLGFTFNEKFTNDTAACMIIGENIFAMLLTEAKFKDFTKKDIADATKSTEMLLAIDAESKDKVIEMIDAAKAAGGTIYMDAADYGWMYQHSFADLDGHQWEVVHMDESAIPEDVHTKEKITVEAMIDAPIEKIWAYWTEPAHITQWNSASADWCTPRATNDLKVGGKFTSRMEARDGSMGFDFEGVYVDVQLKEKIEYNIADGRNVKVLFNKQGDGYKVTEIFDAENTHPADMQRGGWQSILNNFKQYVEQH